MSHKSFKRPPKPVTFDLPRRSGSLARNPKPKPLATNINPDDFELPARRKKTPLNPEQHTKNLSVFRAAQRSYSKRRPKPKPPSAPKPNKKRRKFQRPKLYISNKLKRAISLTAVGLATFAVVAMLIINLFTHNALAVFMDGQHMGYISMNSDLDSQTVHNSAVSRLEDRRRAPVMVDQQITIEPARAGRRNIMSQEDMRRLLVDNFTYQMEIIAIYVNGVFEVLVRTPHCAESVAEMLKDPFVNENTIEAEFIDSFQLVPRFINDSVDNPEIDVYNDLRTPLDAVAALDRPTITRTAYEVQSGDTLGAIAVRFNTTPERIAFLNDRTTNVILRPGEELIIETQKPLLSVRTIDETLSVDIIEMPVEVRYNPDLPEAQRNTIQEGQDGEQQTALRITRVDGVQVSYEVLTNRIIREAIPHIVEEGTGRPVIERR